MSRHSAEVNLHVSRSIDTIVGVGNGIFLTTLGLLVKTNLNNVSLAAYFICSGILWDAYSGLNYLAMFFYNSENSNVKYKKRNLVRFLAGFRILLNVITFSTYIWLLVVILQF
jgi:hypothetical protein